MVSLGKPELPRTAVDETPTDPVPPEPIHLVELGPQVPEPTPTTGNDFMAIVRWRAPATSFNQLEQLKIHLEKTAEAKGRQMENAG
jgi:hypothetical protein